MIIETRPKYLFQKKKLGDKSDKSEREKKKAELLQQLKDLEDSEGTDEMSPLKPSKKNKPTKKNNVKKSGLARIIVPNPKKKRRVEVSFDRLSLESLLTNEFTAGTDC